MSGSSGGATAPAASSGPAAAASAAGSGCGGGAGEGAEEAAKDLADIAAFFRSGLDWRYTVIASCMLYIEPQTELDGNKRLTPFLSESG